MKKINTVGVVGAGTMGSALAQKFGQEGFRVILCDREEAFVAKGMSSIEKTLNEAVERKLFTVDRAGDILAGIKGTKDLKDLKECDLIVEAIFENKEAKSDLFRNLGSVIASDCIVATNTSSFSVTELAESIIGAERFIGLHFFYHAAKNRLVEIIPGDKTSEETISESEFFCERAGKDAIYSKDVYGFAVNRYFVPWLNEAVRIYEEGIATIDEIDSECMRLFGIGMGPFALMNATGISVAYHAEKTLEHFGALYKVAEALKKQADSGELWTLNPGEVVVKNASVIRERMMGIVFFVCWQMLEVNVCSASHLDRGAKIGLRWRKGPVELMRSAGNDETLRLVRNICDKYSMTMPEIPGEEKMRSETVCLEIRNETAVITFDSPETMNALSEVTMNELSEKFEAAESHPAVRNIVITGSGKAFVAGADIKFFVQNIRSNSISRIISFTESGQKIFSRIENSPKKIVAVVNGLTLGGGLELALCADLILAYPNAQFAFPETGIGIYPGLGGTQRTSARTGKGIAKYMIFTGAMLSASDAVETGLADAMIEPVDFNGYLSGDVSFPEKQLKSVSDKWKKLGDLFETRSLDELLSSAGDPDTEKIIKRISSKAPVAVRLADKLIEEEAGCESELEHLEEIFSSQDALLGLTSIGKKVEYTGK